MTGMRAVVFGATGGIGAALLRQMRDSGRYGVLYGGSRSPATQADGSVKPFQFDLTDESTIMHAAAMIGADGPIDRIIIATGALHSPGQPKPEKSFRAIDPQAMARMFAINTIGPALIAKHFLPLMRREAASVFAVLSARVGSISDNRLGGWHSYRASKAALNMLVRNFAIETCARNRQAIVVAIHPGTVDTALSKPFQRGVAPAGLFSTEQSAAHMLGVIDRLSPEDSGGLFAWDGKRISF